MGKKEIKKYITGQQLGLLGGPLYTTYKVLGALHYAEKNKGEAVYWLETNDADFNEINHIEYLDSDGELRSLKWDINSKGYSCGSIRIDDKLPQLLNEFFDSIVQTEHTDGLKKIVLDNYSKGRSLGEASMSLAEELFGEFDLEIFDPSTKEFRKFSRPILMKEAENTIEGEQCNLFFMDGKKRTPVFRKGGKFIRRDGNTVDLESYDLVPSLKTRSICQDAYFNTASYIAGPGEVKYLKELSSNFNFHGVEPAEVIPRMSIDLIEPRIKREMEKIGIIVSDVNANTADDMSRNRLRDITGFDKRELMERSGTLAEEFIRGLKELGLQPDKFRKKLNGDIKELIGRKRKNDKEQNDSVIRRISTIYRYLRPSGMRQERVFNVFYYMNLYGGIGLIKKIYDNYDEKLKFMELNNG
ncbi:MAG: bacillithiol biosynthesis BshC [Acidobacteriota bacterium]